MSIPGRSTLLASSVVFDIASVLLFLEFVGINADGLNISPWSLVRSTCWAPSRALAGSWKAAAHRLAGLPHLPGLGTVTPLLIGATLKLIASVMFCVQPFSGLHAKVEADKLGVAWSNFVGIVFFHAGNVIDSIGLTLTAFDRTKVFSFGNLPVFGINSYVIATWLLVVADGQAYFGKINGFTMYGQLIGSRHAARRLAVLHGLRRCAAACPHEAAARHGGAAGVSGWVCQLCSL